MFTGLIECLGTVRLLSSDGQGGAALAVAEPAYAGALALGESVAVNGVCLTVVDTVGDGFVFQVGPETLARSTLGTLRPGDRVNLERSLRLGDRLGGHIVQGHVDGTGVVRSVVESGEWRVFRFGCPGELLPLMVPKGSVAVDGVSLTLVDVTDDGFSVMLIPHTLAVTTLGRRGAGDPVNLETDLIARHLAKLASAYPRP